MSVGMKRRETTSEEPLSVWFDDLDKYLDMLECDKCKLTRMEFEPDVYCMYHDDCDLDLILRSKYGEEVKVGKVWCEGKGSDCDDELVPTFYDVVMNHVKDALTRWAADNKLGIKFTNKELFWSLYPEGYWFYLTRGGKTLKCHLYIEDRHREEPGKYYYDVTIECKK